MNTGKLEWKPTHGVHISLVGLFLRMKQAPRDTADCCGTDPGSGFCRFLRHGLSNLYQEETFQQLQI